MSQRHRWSPKDARTDEQTCLNCGVRRSPMSGGYRWHLRFVDNTSKMLQDIDRMPACPGVPNPSTLLQYAELLLDRQGVTYSITTTDTEQPGIAVACDGHAMATIAACVLRNGQFDDVQEPTPDTNGKFIVYAFAPEEK